MQTIVFYRGHKPLPVEEPKETPPSPPSPLVWEDWLVEMMRIVLVLLLRTVRDLFWLTFDLSRCFRTVLSHVRLESSGGDGRCGKKRRRRGRGWSFINNWGVEEMVVSPWAPQLAMVCVLYRTQ